VFEATHGTAPDIAGQGIVDPTALILSGELMFEYMGWPEAARMVRKSVEVTIKSKQVTRDLALQMDDAKEVSTEEFGQAVLKNM
jgi:isocitrate dehydrogenase